MQDSSSEEESWASLMETAFSVCSRVDIFYLPEHPVEGRRGTWNTYVGVRLSHLLRLYAMNVSLGACDGRHGT